MVQVVASPGSVPGSILPKIGHSMRSDVSALLGLGHQLGDLLEAALADAAQRRLELGLPDDALAVGARLPLRRIAPGCGHAGIGDDTDAGVAERCPLPLETGLDGGGVLRLRRRLRLRRAGDDRSDHGTHDAHEDWVSHQHLRPLRPFYSLRPAGPTAQGIAEATLLERKDDRRRRGLASRDDADALALIFAYPVFRTDPAEERCRVLWTLPRAPNTLLWLHDFSQECYRGPGCCSDNGMQRTSGAPSGLRGAGSVSANAATSNSAA